MRRRRNQRRRSRPDPPSRRKRSLPGARSQGAQPRCRAEVAASAYGAMPPDRRLLPRDLALRPPLTSCVPPKTPRGLLSTAPCANLVVYVGHRPDGGVSGEVSGWRAPSGVGVGVLVAGALLGAVHQAEARSYHDLWSGRSTSPATPPAVSEAARVRVECPCDRRSPARATQSHRGRGRDVFLGPPGASRPEAAAEVAGRRVTCDVSDVAGVAPGAATSDESHAVFATGTNPSRRGVEEALAEPPVFRSRALATDASRR